MTIPNANSVVVTVLTEKGEQDDEDGGKDGNGVDDDDECEPWWAGNNWKVPEAEGARSVNPPTLLLLPCYLLLLPPLYLATFVLLLPCYLLILTTLLLLCFSVTWMVKYRRNIDDHHRDPNNNRDHLDG